MNYRINSDFPAPFRIFPYIEEINDFKLELELRIRATFAKSTIASYVIAKVPLPKNATIHHELAKVEHYSRVKN